MKNDSYFTLKALFVLKRFEILLKRLDQKDKVNFQIHNVTTWLANNCNIHIAQYLKK